MLSLSFPPSPTIYLNTEPCGSGMSTKHAKPKLHITLCSADTPFQHIPVNPISKIRERGHFKKGEISRNLSTTSRRWGSLPTTTISQRWTLLKIPLFQTDPFSNTSKEASTLCPRASGSATDARLVRSKSCQFPSLSSTPAWASLSGCHSTCSGAFYTGVVQTLVTLLLCRQLSPNNLQRPFFADNLTRGEHFNLQTVVSTRWFNVGG